MNFHLISLSTQFEYPQLRCLPHLLTLYLLTPYLLISYLLNPYLVTVYLLADLPPPKKDKALTRWKISSGS